MLDVPMAAATTSMTFAETFQRMSGLLRSYKPPPTAETRPVFRSGAALLRPLRAQSFAPHTGERLVQTLALPPCPRAPSHRLRGPPARAGPAPLPEERVRRISARSSSAPRSLTSRSFTSRSLGGFLHSTGSVASAPRPPRGSSVSGASPLPPGSGEDGLSGTARARPARASSTGRGSLVSRLYQTGGIQASAGLLLACGHRLPICFPATVHSHRRVQRDPIWPCIPL